MRLSTPFRSPLSDAAALVAGPVRVPTRNMVCWNVAATQPGKHSLVFSIGADRYQKELVAGNAFMPTSLKRPGRHWSEVLLHPREHPFSTESVVQSIEVTYPDRESFTAGTNSWVLYWFVVSMLAAFAAKPFLHVNI